MIIVTGAAGFIGSNICEKLGEKYEILGVDDFSFGSIKNIPENINFAKRDFNCLFHNASDVNDVLVHCATSNIIYSIDNPLETIMNNAINTIKLFKRFKGKIVYLSTSSVYGNADIVPTNEEAKINVNNAYDMSKYLAELYLAQRGNYTTLRLTNVYGEHQLPSNPYCGVVGKIIDCALSGKKFYIYGNGEDTRDYTYVKDVVQAVQKAVLRGPAFTEINIGTGIETSVNELIKFVEEVTKKKIKFSVSEERSIDNIKRRRLDIRKAEKAIDWLPEVGVMAGIRKTVEWQKKFNLSNKD